MVYEIIGMKFTMHSSCIEMSPLELYSAVKHNIGTAQLSHKETQTSKIKAKFVCMGICLCSIQSKYFSLICNCLNIPRPVFSVKIK